MKISIITVCYNAASTIKDAIESVLSQDYADVEYIIIDGNSTDGTQEIVKSFSLETGGSAGTFNHSVAQWISEPDKGIYDAMNKGLKKATGEVVGILNADDFYTDKTIISQIAKTFEKPEIDAVFWDLVFVDPNNLD